MQSAKAKRQTVLGIMSGTSLDGADYALCAIQEEAPIRLLESWYVPFPKVLRGNLRQAAEGKATSHQLAQWHHDLGRFYARHALAGSKKLRPYLVGLHGQTIFHHPNQPHPATMQLGEPTYLASSLGVPVISNFRAADIAAGGQGAPLATHFHLRVFAHRGEHVCVNNLGGISNVTCMDWRRGPAPTLMSFDTGPANLLLDQAARHYSGDRRTCDRDGAWARRGRWNASLVRKWLRHPFLRRKPPKSTGREMFGAEGFRTFWQDLQSAELDRHDALATLTQFTAQSIALNYQRFIVPRPHRVILAGGGASNLTLVQLIRDALQRLDPGIRVDTSRDAGWPHSSVEPAAFAWLAWLRWKKQSGHHPETTGATRTVLLGQITEL